MFVKLRKCCKAQWVWVHQRIVLYKRYLVLLFKQELVLQVQPDMAQTFPTLHCFCSFTLIPMMLLCWRDWEAAIHRVAVWIMVHRFLICTAAVQIVVCGFLLAQWLCDNGLWFPYSQSGCEKLCPVISYKFAKPLCFVISYWLLLFTESYSSLGVVKLVL